MKKSMIVISVISVCIVVLLFLTLNMTGCKSTIKVPEGITDECQITWALLIAYHESGKNENTKSGMTLLLQDAQTKCFDSINKKELRKIALQCRKEVFQDGNIDLRDLQKKEQFTNCIKTYKGEI